MAIDTRMALPVRDKRDNDPIVAGTRSFRDIRVLLAFEALVDVSGKSAMAAAPLGPPVTLQDRRGSNYVSKGKVLERQRQQQPPTRITAEPGTSTGARRSADAARTGGSNPRCIGPAGRDTDERSDPGVGCRSAGSNRKRARPMADP